MCERIQFCREMPGGNFGNQSTLNCGSTRPRNRSRRLCKRRPACPATHINAGGLKVAAIILIIKRYMAPRRISAYRWGGGRSGEPLSTGRAYTTTCV